MLESVPAPKPLEERILDMMESLNVWSFRAVKNYFPTTHDKAIYRALANLEKSGRIRCVGWKGRTKEYTTHGISNLPSFVAADGNRYNLRLLFPAISMQYTDDYHWKKLDKLNNFWILLGNLFIAAHTQDEEEAKELYKAAVFKLREQRDVLREIQQYIETVLDHPIMHGDIEVMKNILRQEMPTQEEINTYRSWVGKYLNSRGTNAE